MEVILLESVAKLGGIGDVVNVKNGYARNFLIPQGKVLRATNENKAEFEARKSDIEKENTAKRDAAEKEAKKIVDKFVTIIRQAGEDGRLYGSVTSRDIAEAVSALGIEVKRSQIALNQPIKYIGIRQEAVALHGEVLANVNVNVARSDAEAEEAKKEFLNPKKEEKAEEYPVEKKVAKEESAAEEK